MTKVNVYLTFNGNCREAFDFYSSAFEKEIRYVSTFEEMPEGEGIPAIPEDMKNKIMHMSLPISQETILMGSDTGGNWSPNFTKGNNFAVSISAESKIEADRLFNELSKEGVVIMAMNDTFWGDYFGSFTDKYGINWMVGCMQAANSN